MSRRLPSLVLVASLACAPTEDGPADPSRPAGTPLALSPEPTVSVGVLEGDPVEMLDGVRDPFLLADGRLVIPLEGSSEIRIFDGEGGFLSSLGREGEGPGEFVGLRAAWPRGDTIEAWDSRTRRVTRFLPDGGVEVVRVDATVPLDGGLGPLGAGWALEGLDFGDLRDRWSAHAFARDGSHLGEIAVTDGMARYSTPAVRGPHPVSPTAVLAVAADEVWVGDVMEPVLRAFDASGTLLREVPVPLEPTGDPEAVFAAVVDTAVARAPDDPTLRTRLEAFPDPEGIPLFWGLLVDEEGFLWVRPYEPFVHAMALGGLPTGDGGPGGSWLLIAPDGAPAGEIAVPDGVTPVQVTRDAVVGIHRDAYGVESVRVYALTRN